MSIPLVDLSAQYQSIRQEMDDAIQRVLHRGDFILGKDVELFEREFAEYCGALDAVGVASGTEALRLALLACGVGRGDEVITTPFTFIATAEAISHVGAIPVFVDVDPETANLDPAQLEMALTSKTKAVLPVHLYGRPAAMDRICAFAKRHGLWVIEDAAQAHGARRGGCRAGAMGDIGCFSFYPGKNLGAYGDAGAAVTGDSRLAEQVRLLRDHGRQDKYEHRILGWNSRMDTLQAAVLRVKLRRLEEWNARRRDLAARYRAMLGGIGFAFPRDEAQTEPVYHLFVLRTPRRDRVRESLASAGVASGVHYPIPVHLQPAYRSLGHRPGDFPESERAAREVLSLPMYPELSDSQVETVANVIREALATVACEGPNAPGLRTAPGSAGTRA